MDRLPRQLPDNIVRLDTRLLLTQPDLLTQVKQIVVESFAGTSVAAPEGLMSWTIDPAASIDNDPAKPLKESPTKERLACFKWIVDFLFALELRYGACFLLMEKDAIVSVALLIPPNTNELHEPNACILTSAICQVGSPPALWSSGVSKARLDAVSAAISKLHHEVMNKQMHWYLHMMATSSKHQGKGYGTRLMDFVASLSDLYHVPMYLETVGKRCINFYGKFGFVVHEKSDEIFVVEDIKRFPGDKLKGVAMVKQPKNNTNMVALK